MVDATSSLSTRKLCLTLEQSEFCLRPAATLNIVTEQNITILNNPEYVREVAMMKADFVLLLSVCCHQNLLYHQSITKTVILVSFSGCLCLS